MRTTTGCFISTPTPILHGASRLPLLEDKIITDTTVCILQAIASNTLLGQEYLEWNGEYDGWTPMGTAWAALRNRIPTPIQNTIQTRTLPPASHLDHLAKCKFRLPSKDRARRKHEQGKLIPAEQDVSIWSDGSLTKTDTPLAGAAAIVHDHKHSLTNTRARRLNPDRISSSHSASARVTPTSFDQVDSGAVVPAV